MGHREARWMKGGRRNVVCSILDGILREKEEGEILLLGVGIRRLLLAFRHDEKERRGRKSGHETRNG